MSCWWRASTNTLYNLSTFSKIKFNDEIYEIDFYVGDEIAFQFNYLQEREKYYNKAKHEIIELLGYS
jgi:hypothetical protein|uniref:Uncharacterized protein n=1 Tax=viral metagenome TaxID=1070528 RepID=A0A6C0BUD2_9ZZZZ